MAHPIIDLQQISKRYPGKTVLSKIDLIVKPKEKVAIMGQSGCGKSTLLAILGLLTSASSGDYFLNGIDVNALDVDEWAALRSRYLGFIFQSFLLMPTLTVLENVLLPISYSHKPMDESIERALALLDRVGMKSFADAKPSRLSGGQQQRVAIARALINQPQLILGDEPTGSLDLNNGREVMEYLCELNRTQELSLVVVTHTEETARFCDRVIYIQDGMIES